MDLVLKGKVALVAASSRGLGRAVAEELAIEGASLILCSRKAETIEKTASEIATSTGADILALPCDVSKADDVARQVLPGMKERRWGRILNITSIAVKQPVDNLILSNSLRAAVTGFARTLANEVATFGITVNNIMPGYTRTERVEELARMMADKEGITPAEFIARWEKEIPMRRLGEPREFAALAGFLVSERASYITGTSIPVDGGWIRSLL